MYQRKSHVVYFLVHTDGILVQSNLGPSNSDESNTMDGSSLFQSPVNFPYIYK